VSAFATHGDESPFAQSVAAAARPRSRRANGLAAALVALLSTACSSVSPGLQFKPGQLEARSTPEAPIAIVTISPQILVEQAEARTKAATTRPKDPLAAEAAKWE
jgi:polysaccharide export outer membrane protein